MNEENISSLPSGEAVDRQASSNEPLRFDGLQVLIVEDDRDTRELFTFVMEMAGAKIAAVASITEALKVLQNYQPDLLISDISLPDGDGCTLIGQVQVLEAGRGRRLPAIAVTAAARESDRLRVLAAGFQKYLAKPIEPDKLIEEIASLIQSENSGTV